MPLISVVVPIYNQEKYLEKCVQSLRGQTLEDLEIILVDDGSTDKSGAFCDAYAKEDKRIIVIHKENGGLSDARNAGIDIATGKYIAFVDSDDYVSTDMYQIMYEALQAENADMVVCNVRLVDGNNCLIDKQYEFEKMSYSGQDIINGRCVKEDNYFLSVVAWNKLMKRDKFEPIRYPKGKYHEDEFVFHKLYGRMDKVVCISEELYFYRQVSGTITDVGNVLYRLDRVEAMYERIQYCLEKQILDNILFFERTMYFSLEAVVFSKKTRNKDVKKHLKELKKLHKEVVLRLKQAGVVKGKFVFDRRMFWCVPKIRNVWKRIFRSI